MERALGMAYNRRPMGSERLFHFVFVFYCTTIGAILVTLPWSASWDLMISYLPYGGLQALKLPLVRGLLSGFGLVHLVWALHDTVLLVRLDAPRDEKEHDDGHPENSGDQ